MDFEAEVPQGLRPGETFTVQTPSGPYELTVPFGTVPGQKVQFKISEVGARPTVMGSAYAAPEPITVQGRVVGRDVPVHGQVVQGQPYRVDPLSADAKDIPLLKGIPENQQATRMDQVRKGGELARTLQPFPDYRKYRDVLWIAPFLLVVIAMTGASIYYAGAVFSKADASDADFPSLAALITSGVVAGFASIVAAFAYLALAKRYPECVVWSSLLFGPLVLIVVGLVLMSLGAIVPGVILGFLGLIQLTCVFMCYLPLIPFMIKIVKTIAHITNDNPMLLAVALLGSMAGIAWSLICGITFTGVYLKQEDRLEDSSQGVQYGLLFVAALIFYWGGQVAYNICHVSYCGVFGSWYYGKNQDTPLRSSLYVALTTSFGSIVFGSFLVAAIRALEFVVKMARRDAQEEGNMVAVILLCIVEMIISCIGDLLEYFSEWAYVQCAVRGASFMEAARITYSLCTCASLEYVCQDLLINSVVSLGSLVCGGAGAAAGAVVGLGFGGGAKVLAGTVIGLFAGIFAGGSAMGVISSGTKTILVLWAENSEPLRRTHPEIHEEFEARILRRINE